MKLAAYVPVLFDRFPDAAFTPASLEHVASRCVKGFPTYAELSGYLADWWQQHRPMPIAIASPLTPPPPPDDRPPPTAEEIAAVRAAVEEMTAHLHASALYRDSQDFDARMVAQRATPRYLTPEQLDRINPLPNGRKRVQAATTDRPPGKTDRPSDDDPAPVAG